MSASACGDPASAPSVAPVSVVTGLNAAFPISFSQICGRRSRSTGAFSPADRNAAETSPQRSLGGSPAGVPSENRVPFQMADHARRDDLGRAVEDAADRPAAAPIAAVTTPPGSTLSTMRPASAPPSPWKYHQGIAVLGEDDHGVGSQQRPDRGCERGQAVRLQSDEDHVRLGDGRDVVGGGRMRLEVAARALHAHTVRGASPAGARRARSGSRRRPRGRATRPT